MFAIRGLDLVYYLGRINHQKSWLVLTFMSIMWIVVFVEWSSIRITIANFGQITYWEWIPW
jgi:hypothetical protein